MMLKVKTRLRRKVSILRSVLSRKSFLITTIISLLLFSTLYAEAQYDISIDKSQQVADNIYEFDVVIKSNREAFTLTSYQVSFRLNQEIINDREISFSYVDGTSELSNIPSVGVGLNLTDGIPELTFASLPGNDIINSGYIRIGHFRLQNTNSFVDVPSISFNFDGKITTILTGSNFADITKSFGNLVEYEIIGVTATATTDTNTAPEKTIDGLGYYDGDPYARWAAQPMPQYIIFDLGSEVSVSMTKFSFFYFQEGRIYQYTIALSDNQVNWQEVVVNASSAPEEWTVNQFEPQLARYVKLVFISSNDPGNWANLWEAQIWGEGQTTSVGLGEDNESPENFELSQNYPNPFNPSTNIEFELKKDVKVKLAVYNVLGEEVAELFNGEINAGTHKFEFNAVGLASGVYVYRLDAGNEFTETKKMVLMR